MKDKKVRNELFFSSLGAPLYGAMMIAKNFPVYKWVKTKNDDQNLASL